MSKESHMEMVVLSQHKSQISGMISETFGLVWPGWWSAHTEHTGEEKNFLTQIYRCFIFPKIPSTRFFLSIFF